MYLIKVEMARYLPEVRQALADCQKMHQLVTGLFDAARQDANILYRTNFVADQLHLYLYASTPVTAAAEERYRVMQRDLTPWLEQLQPGQYLKFDLIASPSKKISVDGQKNSRRRILREPAERQAWLERKAAQSGFSICQVMEQEQIHVSGKHHAEKGGTMYHDAYHYQGVLQITDAEIFRNALQSGIGSGKAYGFGMMMVKKL